MPLRHNNIGVLSVTKKKPEEDYVSESKHDGFNHERMHTELTGLLDDSFGRNRVLTWVRCTVGEENVFIRDADVVQEYGVPQRLLAKFIEKEIDDHQAFLTMPRAIILVIVYSLSFIWHDGTAIVRDVEDAITVDLKENAVFAYTTPGAMAHKNIDDVHSITDVYSWLRVGFYPLLFKSSEAWSEGLAFDSKPVPSISKGYYLNYNRIIGGAVLEQARAHVEACRQPTVSEALEMTCQPADQVTSFHNLHVEPLHSDAVMSKAEHDPKLSRWFLIMEQADAIELRLKQIEQSHWMDNSTAQVSVHFMTYNAHFDTMTLTGVHFLFARSGHIWKKIVHSTHFLKVNQSIGNLVPDVFFVMIILWIFIDEIREATGQIRSGYQRGMKIWETLADYVDVYNVIDWATIGIACTLIAMWLLYGQMIADLRNGMIGVYLFDKSIQPIEGGFEHNLIHQKLDGLMETFRSVNLHYHILRLVASIYPVALVLRLFKTFQAQPRLAIVTRTLTSASVDAAHFAVVFFSVYFALAVMAVALFGREVADFSTFWRAFSTCFVMLMGDFDIEAMVEVGRPMATVWFIVFNVMVMLIMLNMLLAIIMDAYTEVKANVQCSDTLYFQIATFWRRLHELRTGDRLSLNLIQKQLISSWERDGLKCENLDELGQKGLKTEWDTREIMTLDDFQSYVPAISRIQAKRLMKGSVRFWRMMNETGLTLSEVLNFTNHIIVSMNRKMTNFNVDVNKKMDRIIQQSNALAGTAEASVGIARDGLLLEPPMRTSPGSPHEPVPIAEQLSIIQTRLGKIEAGLETSNRTMESRFGRLEASIEQMASAVARSSRSYIPAVAGEYEEEETRNLERFTTDGTRVTVI